jgi:hypothetical protein
MNTSLWQMDLLWRGDLSPLGCEAAPKPFTTVYLKDRMHRFWGCCATHRGINPLATVFLSGVISELR